MALTKISEGGVKDDTASQAKIADEAVDEARLQISNAGTNGQFLSKSANTGGLTWADANSYTHPNHSGEVTSTGDGATVIASNIVDEDNLKVSNSPTNGQLLSAQSGNTGGLTWTDPPASAPQIEATADGAITAGDTCVVNTNGTVKKVTATYVEKTPVLGTYSTLGGGYNSQYVKVGFDTNRGQALFLYQSQNGATARIFIGTIANGDLTLNTDLSLDSGSRAYGIVWSKTSALGVALYGGAYDASTDTVPVYAEAFTSDGSTLTFGAKLQITSITGDGSASISWDSAANKFLVVVGESKAATSPSDTGVSDAYVLSHSGTTLSKGTRVQVANFTYRYGCLAYDEDNNKHLWTYRCQYSSGSGGKLAARIITVSGTTPTASSEVLSDSADIDAARPVYIGSGKFVVAYELSGPAKARFVTVSGTTPSFGTASADIGTQLQSAYYHGLSLTYDRTGKVFIGQISSTGNNASFRILTLDTSNNTISAISSSTALGGGRGISAYYDPNTQMHIFGGQKADAHGFYRTAVTSDMTTNVTTENYIGIAASTVSSGATATIDVSGATNSSQSSLTAGQKYFVQKDGSLGLTAATPFVFAGTAIAATKLIVNDQAPAVSDMGMWKLVASADLDTYSGNEYDIFTDFGNRTEKWWKLVFSLEAPDGSNDFSGCGLRVKVNNSWQSSNYDRQQFYVESTNEIAQRLNAQTRYGFAMDQKWHRGEITFYDPSASGIYKIFEYTGFSANHAWQGTTDSPNPERSAGGYVGSTNPIQGIRFWKNSGNFGKIHYGLFASNGW